MKKIAIASVIALATTAASAWEIGVTGTRDFAGSDRNFAGITVSNTYDKLTATAGFERSTGFVDAQNRWTVAAGYNIANVGPVSISPKLGLAYLNNNVAADGYALTTGIEASVPLNEKISATTEFSRQFGQKRVEQFNGNRFTVGLKYKF